MLTEKDYCDLELTTILQEVGMSIKNVVATSPRGATKWYSNVTLYEAQKWLREEKGIHVEVYFAELCNKQPLFEWVIVKEYDYSISNLLSSKEKYFSSEEALSEGIKEAVKILKDGIGE